MGVVASRLANMCEGRPKNTISIDTVSKSVNDKNFDYANLQNGNDKRSQSEAAEMECRFSNATQKAGVIRGFFYPLLTPWRMEENTEKQKLYTLYSGIK